MTLSRGVSLFPVYLSALPRRQSDWEIDSDNGDSPDDDEDGTGYTGDHVLVLLDCGASMWKGVFSDPEYPDDLLSPFDFVLSKLTTFLKLEIRQRATWKTGKRNGFGVYLYNTENLEHVEWDSPLSKGRTGSTTKTKSAAPETKDASGYKDDDEEEEDEEGEEAYKTDKSTTVHELIPLEPPGIATIMTLKAVQDDGFVDRAFDIQETYAPKSENHDNDRTALQTAFTMAGRILQDAKCVQLQKKDDRPPDRVRIWIMSNQDMIGEYVHAAAKDLVDRKFEIFLWPLPSPHKDAFDYAARFESMPYIQKQTNFLTKRELLEWWESEALTDELGILKIVRPIHRLPMILPGDEESDQETPHLQLHWYRLVQTAKRPNKISVHQETGVQLNPMTQIIEKGSLSQEILYEKVTGDTETPAKESPRLCTYVEIQGTRIPLSPEDKAELKAKSHPHTFSSLRVIGFRPADSIDRTTASIEPAYFCIPPDDADSRVKGSRAAFSALHQSMKNKNALMLGEVLTRKTATTRLVAAWALDEQTEPGEDDDDEEYMVRPPGLLVIILPFQNEIKKPISDVATRSTEPLASESLVEEAKAIVNKLTIAPKLGTHFKNASLELFWDKLEELALNHRKVQENDETMMTREDVVTRVGDHLDRFMELLPDDPVPVKKKRERELVPDDSGVDWQEAYADGQLESCKVDELKKYLRSVGEKTSGKKAELIERMIPHLQKESKV